MAINCIGINNYKLFTLFLPLTFIVISLILIHKL